MIRCSRDTEISLEGWFLGSVLFGLNPFFDLWDDVVPTVLRVVADHSTENQTAAEVRKIYLRAGENGYYVSPS